MSFKYKKNKGFTLIEVMVGIALFAVVSAVLVSVMSFSFRMNYTNKANYDADSYSKSFFESIKNDACKPIGQSSNFTNKYYTGFDDVSEVYQYAEKRMNDLSRAVYPSIDESGVGKTAEEIIESFDGTAYANKNIGFVMEIHWKNDEPAPTDTNKVYKIYEIETWTWDVDKGIASMINRKTLLAPRTP